MPNGQSLDTIKIHKVPNLEVWEQNYQTTQNPNGLIEPGDLVSFPPNLLGEVLPDYPQTAGTTFLKAETRIVTTSSGNKAETETSWDTVDSFPSGGQAGDVLTSDGNNGVEWTDSATGNLIDLANSISASSTDTQIPTAKAVWSAIPSPSNADPIVDGTTAAPGESTAYARADHVHPTDTSRQPAGNYATLDNNKITADQATARIKNSGDLFNNSNVYSLKAADNGCLIVDNNSGSNEHIYQIEPYNSSSDSDNYYNYLTGTEIEIMKIGTGTVKIQPKDSTNARLNDATAFKTISDQYTSAVLKYLGDNKWVIQGAIS